MHVASHPQIPQCIRLALELDPVVQTDAQWWGSCSSLHCPQGPVFSLFSLFSSCSSGKPLSSCLVTICSALFFPECHRIETWHVFSSASLTLPMHVMFPCLFISTCYLYPVLFLLVCKPENWKNRGSWRLSHPSLPRCLCFYVLHWGLWVIWGYIYLRSHILYSTQRGSGVSYQPGEYESSCFHFELFYWGVLSGYYLEVSWLTYMHIL